MVWSVTIGGVTTQQTFNQASFSGGAGGNAYADETTGLPAALQRVVEQCRDIFLGSSSTSATIGSSGSFSFASTPNRPWVANLPIKVVDGSNSANYMTGAVTSYDASAGTLVFAASASAGSGTISSWSITISGTGPAGPAGPAWAGGSISAVTYMVGAAFNLGASVDVATATTANIGAAVGNLVRLTGTTQVDSFGSIAALNGYPVRLVRCQSAFQLTHNGTSMILPAGGSNITTATNDWFIAVPLGSSNWEVVFYQRADGTALVSSMTSATQSVVDAGSSTTAFIPPNYLVNASFFDARNYLFNPEGLIFQRTASTADNAYVWDRWRLLLGAANAATVSQLTTGLPALAKNAMRLTVGSGSSNKFGIFQILEGKDVFALRGKSVTLQAYLQATAALTDIRMAIVEWTGTEDATSGDPISAWNSAATVPTYSAGWANLNTPANLGVTTSFARYAVSASIGATATNLGIFIWNEDTGSTQTTDKLDITMAQLVPVGAAASYVPRCYAEELEMCHRYCWSWATADGNIGHGFADGNTTGTIALKFTTTMRTTPTFSVSAVTHFQVDAVSGTSGATTGLSAAGLSAEGVDLRPVRSGSTWTAGQGIRLLAANASAQLTFTAEL